MPRRLLVFSLVVAALATSAEAQGQGTKQEQNPPDPRFARRPPPGIEIPDNVRKELTDQLVPLEQAITELAKSKDPKVINLLPDVQIFHKAVHDGLKYQEMYVYDSDKKSPFPLAKQMIQQGLERARQLKEGKPLWTSQTGLVPRAYVSKIDGSIQPYGLIVPESYVPGGSQKYRLDVWLHGMHETLSELDFLKRRNRERGVFQPKDTIVLHPYGRYLNVYRFAGEIDVLEGIEAVKKQYNIDEDRIAMRGFSLGGAGCWQLGLHYSDHFFAMNVGAGWVEAAAFPRTKGPDPLPAWEQLLYHWYECPDLAVNLYNLPTIVYCGERDGQKEAGFRMARAAKEHGIDVVNLIAPNTGHEYHPDYRDEVERRMASLALKGRDRTPHKVKLATFTLKYNRMHWVTIDGLEQHWEPTRVDAEYSDKGSVMVTTRNVTGLTLSFPAGWAPFDVAEPVSISIDGQTLTGPRPLSDRSWLCTVHRESGAWRLGPLDDGLRKKHDLQGPIDDAFMDSFVFVRPTGKFMHPGVERWVQGELDHAITAWRQQFRGQTRVKDDKDITAADIASSNLVLWGDPSSNAVLAKIADKLPIRWNEKEVVAGAQHFPAERHVPILIHPNPLNSERYVVLNSGFTYRDADYSNHPRQFAKLPDWAIVDLETPPDSRRPGKIAAADFFDERWLLKVPRK
jgi:Prolyl oligopeptidase family